jgi:hypothetical protein
VTVPEKISLIYFLTVLYLGQNLLSTKTLMHLGYSLAAEFVPPPTHITASYSTNANPKHMRSIYMSVKNYLNNKQPFF